ncbi:MAG TPA: aldo/keto reductase [Polyangiaceae bacterium]|nr:aldo/keto reductase [Polyangiaceae bacterium]
MQKLAFGSMGLELTRLGFGAMPLAIQARPSEDQALRVLVRAIEAGLNWIDTADRYCIDESDVGYGERLVARALAQTKVQDVLVTTKVGYLRPNGDWVVDGRPDRIKAACEASLRALGVSSLFLYQLHAVDPAVPLAESIGALAQLQREGKIRYLGLCNVDVGQIQEAQCEAEISSVQNRCNLFDRWSFINGVVDYCAERNLAFIAHSPLGGHQGHVRASESPVLRAIAERRGATPHEVCLLWLLQQSGPIFPIPGASRLASLESNLRVADATLSEAELRELSEAFPNPGFPKPTLVRARNQLRRVARRLKRLAR